jgi:SAM-dependent methyltransferase
MRALPFADNLFDLLWCEGAAYIMGVAAALRSRRRLLRRDGRIAFTDAVWLTEHPPEELERWWQAGYPEMGTITDCLRKVEASGYRVLAHFVLPESAWWDDYYEPMEERLVGLRADLADEPAALAVLDECQREIDYYRRWSSHYGYLFVAAAG